MSEARERQTGSDQGKEYEDNPARQYEDFVKRIINSPPEGPTPSGYAYYLPRPQGKPVSFDDCQWKTGFLFEIKGEMYTRLMTLPYPIIGKNTADGILEQSADQIEASGGRAMVWVFAEEEAARKAAKLFDDTDHGRENIVVVHIPWVRSNP